MKNQFAKLFALFALAALPTGCSKATVSTNPTPVPTATPTPAPVQQVTLTFANSTNSGERVANLTVVVNGFTTVTNVVGQVTVAVSEGNPIDVPATNGYCERKTTYHGENTVTLTSTETGCEYEADIMYHRKDTGSVSPLRRMSGDNYTVSVDANLASQTDKVQYAMDQASAVTGGDVTFSLVPSGGEITVGVDASKAPGRGCNAYFSSREIWCSSVEDATKKILAHEFGHLLGFGHTSVNGDLMCNVPGTVFPATFSERERLAWKKMVNRPIGNRWPDIDPSR